jgi:hypothetical protein
MVLIERLLGRTADVHPDGVKTWGSQTTYQVNTTSRRR